MANNLDNYLGAVLGAIYGGSLEYQKKYNKLSLSADAHLTIISAYFINNLFLGEDLTAKLFIKKIFESYIAWFYLQSGYIPNPDRNSYIFEVPENEKILSFKNFKEKRNIDEAVITILSQGKMFSKILQGNKLNSSSCLTKLSPVALFFHKKPEAAFKMGIEIGALTHGNNNAQVASGAYCYLLCAIINEINPVLALSGALKEIKAYSEGYETFLALSKLKEFLEDRKKYSEVLSYFESPICAGNTLALAFYAFSELKDNPEKAFDFAYSTKDGINAAILTGSFIGALKGVSVFNQEEINKIDLVDEIINIVQNLYQWTHNLNEE